MTDVTIRGIDDEVYSLFSAEARKRGVPIGELVTLVMRALIEEAKKGYCISNLKELIISENELQALDEPVVISNIGKLTFKNDVKWTTFKKNIEEIRSIGKLTIPKTFPRLQVLTKCRSVGKIIYSTNSN